MKSLSRTRGVFLAGLVALGLGALMPDSATAKPKPGVTKARSGFRLFARPLGALTANRIYCGLNATGEVCVDSTNSSTIGGGFWPKGTVDQYVFNSGLQLAGIIASDNPANPWAGDTTGAFFFDPKGTTQHGQGVTPIYNSTNAEDLANWPAAAFVPGGAGNDDANKDNYNIALHGRPTASEGDVWWLSWEGNPGQNAGRPHPMGLLVETRGMAYNSPSGNQDIVYFIYTFYNITSTNPADYANVRPSLRDTLLAKATEFQALNNAKFGVTLPTGGYTIGSLFATFGADMDVADAGANYASVALPFNMGFTYQNNFGGAAGWTFDPSIFRAPFFAGSGFVGVKYLKSPVDPATGNEVGLTLFSNTSNGGNFGDPGNTQQLYRYTSNNVDPTQGDDNCNVGGKVCFINNSAPDDMRFFQSSGPLTVAPGQFQSIVVAYIFAAPVAAAGCPGAGCDITPGDLNIIRNLDQAATAAGPDNSTVNPVDRVAGWIRAADVHGAGTEDTPPAETPADGVLQQDEVTVVPGSLYGKASVAQTIFDLRFLQPFAPEAPQFFLVPGDNQVTVLWRPSNTETVGDAYFSVSSTPLTAEGEQNLIYDPNYRQFDIEGYRIYRGRVDSPNELTMIAQFDYTNTTFTDSLGILNPATNCAPDIGLFDGCPALGAPVSGVQLVEPQTFNIEGTLVQYRQGARVLKADTTWVAVDPSVVDTAITGREAVSGQRNGPALENTGVPFVFVDDGTSNLNNVPAPRNNFRYFYSVVAFDVNSYRSGPSSLESSRNTRSVTPTQQASNVVSQGTVETKLFGRGVELDLDAPVPTLDPVNGTFSGPFPPANAFRLGLAEFVSQVLQGEGTIAVRLDSINLGSPYAGTPTPHVYWYTATGPSGSSTFSLPITMDVEQNPRQNWTSFTATQVNGELAQRFGGTGDFALQGRLDQVVPGPEYVGLYGRGCVNARPGFAATGTSGCAYNGSRWFDGPSPAQNETFPDPNAGNTANFSGTPMTNLNNAGKLAGVDTIFNLQSYQAGSNTYRTVEGILAGARRAADFNVYWGAGGTVDSVIDVTHNVPVPFSPNKLGGTWGILNQAAALGAGSFDGRPELTITDFGCVEPLKSIQTVIGCTAATPYELSQTAVPGPVAVGTGSTAASQTGDVLPHAGFTMYLAGDIMLFELTGGAVPASGTVWTLRQYAGAISGGKGAAGDYGPYTFTEPLAATIADGGETIRPRPATAVGSEISIVFNSVNTVTAATVANLEAVHTVPDPYYVTSEYENTTDTKIIKFVNLPAQAIIRIYSSSGVLVALLENPSASCQNVGLNSLGQANNPNGGECVWNVRNRNNQVVASGVYFYHIESGGARRVGRFTVINFAQ